jgi:3-dehydroquinate dehydratase-2
MAKILVLNGPNLNLLGRREPTHYGATTLGQIHSTLKDFAVKAGCELEAFQTNAEHELVEYVHGAGEQGFDFLIINPAALTHTSIALRDALLAVELPFIEVHLSNIYAREAFRQHSYFSDIAYGTISGFGAYGYEMALLAALRHFNVAAT